LTTNSGGANYDAETTAVDSSTNENNAASAECAGGNANANVTTDDDDDDDEEHNVEDYSSAQVGTQTFPIWSAPCMLPKENKMVMGEPQGDLRYCNIWALSFVTMICVFLLKGDVHFKLKKSGMSFTFTYFEYALLFSNRLAILSAIDQGVTWCLPNIQYYQKLYNITTVCLFRSIKIKKSGKMVIHLKKVIGPITHFNQTVSSKIFLTLTSEEVRQLLSNDSQFYYHVNTLLDCRLSINVVLVALVNLLKRTTSGGSHYNHMTDHQLNERLSTMFSINRRNVLIELQVMIQEVYKEINLDKRRQLSPTLTLNEIVEFIFPGQVPYILELCNNPRNQYFKCPIIYCITPHCRGHCAQPVY
jgi:hypothetical protein